MTTTPTNARQRSTTLRFGGGRLATLACALVAVGLIGTTARAAGHGSRGASAGAVYVASNAESGNEILSYRRGADGNLQFVGHFPTGGTGTGGGLGNQGGLVISDDGRFLLTVNAGSNDISCLAIGPNGRLRLVDRAPSGGVLPLSIAVSRELVYIVNGGGGAGDVDSISGFELSRNGRLRPLEDSTRSLSGPSVGPAQVSFNPEGDILLVTEKATNLLTTFLVGQDGRVISQQSTASVGVTPFGFAFAGRAKVFVTNAVGGAPGAASVSSYYVDETAAALNLAPAVPVEAGAACWLVVNEVGDTAYVTNTASNSVSILALGALGAVDLVENVTTGSLAGPVDEVLAPDEKFLYVRNAGNQSISIFAVQEDGSLVAQPALFGLPASANGLAIR